MSYKILFLRAAERNFNNLNRQIQRRISKKLESLKSNPFPAGVKKLQGTDFGDAYRVRFGDYRIIYEVLQNELVILIIDVGSRSDIYR